MTQPMQSDNIIAMLGLGSLPDEQKLAIVNRAADLVQKRLLVKVLDGLPAEDRREFERLLESGDQAAVSSFMEQRVPNLPEMVESEIAAVKQELSSWSEDLLKE